MASYIIVRRQEPFQFGREPNGINIDTFKYGYFCRYYQRPFYGSYFSRPAPSSPKPPALTLPSEFLFLLLNKQQGRVVKEVEDHC